VDRGENPVRIVRKKARANGGHHGGAWKVAYADFVTAMMALFIVLWIVSMNEKVKKSVASYFEDPVKFSKEHSGQSSKPSKVQSIHPVDVKADAQVTPDNLEEELDKLRHMAKIIEEQIAKTPDFKRFRNQIKIIVTEDGLRIELQEKSPNEGVFFDLSSARLKPDAVKLIEFLARQISTMVNPVIMEGHTDATLYLTSDYSNWDLSTDRANSARRVLEKGLRRGQLTEVRGYADTKLRNAANPYDYSNRRITILIKPNTHDIKKAESAGDSKQGTVPSIKS
jgi:chemotaxis protein MotB